MKILSYVCVFAMLTASGVGALEITPDMEAQLSPQTSKTFARRQGEMGLHKKAKLEAYTKVVNKAEEEEEEEKEEGEDVFAELRASVSEKMATHVKNENSLSTLMLTGAETDAMLYTDTFKPQPGHELYFDWDGFGAYAKATEATMIEEFAKNTKIEHKVSVNNTNKVRSLNTRSFFQACLELNFCIIEPDAPPTPNVCGQFGVNVAATYEVKKTGNKWDATLTLTGELNAGISFGITKVFVTTFYLFGQVDWEFAITGTGAPPYGSVYSAVAGALKALMMKMIKARKVNKKFAERAKTVRDALVKEFTAAQMTSEASKLPQITQTDEIRGLVQLHRAILTGYYNAIKNPTANADPVITWQKAQEALTKQVVINLWPSKTIAADAVGTFEKLITKDDKECVKSIVKTEMSKQLFCSMLAYGALLEDPSTAWFGQGTRANMQRMMPELFAGAWPTDVKTLNAIVAVLEVYDASVKLVTTAEWNTKVAQQVPFEEKDASGKMVTNYYTKIKDVASIQQVNIDDPCRIARSFYQLLASPGADLDKKIQANANLGPKSGDPVFTLTKTTITGGIGATLGTARVGYCTLDTNSFQARLSKSWTWTNTTGWQGTGAQLWVGIAFNSYFQIQMVWGFGAQESDAVKDGITYLGCLPNQKGDKPDGSKGDMIIADSTTAWLSVITAENMRAVGAALKTMIKSIYTTIKAGGKKKAGIKAKWDTLKSGMATSMETGFTQVKAALPDQAKTQMPASLSAFFSSLFGTGVQALLNYLLTQFTAMEFSTMMNFGLSINTLKDKSEQVLVTLSSTKIFKLDLGKAAFYVIYGNEIEGEAA